MEKTVPDWFDTPAEIAVIVGLLSVVLGALSWLIKAQIAMQREFKPNGGSSTRDQLNRIEGDVRDLRKRLDDHIQYHLEEK